MPLRVRRLPALRVARLPQFQRVKAQCSSADSALTAYVAAQLPHAGAQHALALIGALSRAEPPLTRVEARQPGLHRLRSRLGDAVVRVHGQRRLIRLQRRVPILPRLVRVAQVVPRCVRGQDTPIARGLTSIWRSHRGFAPCNNRPRLASWERLPKGFQASHSPTVSPGESSTALLYSSMASLYRWRLKKANPKALCAWARPTSSPSQVFTAFWMFLIPCTSKHDDSKVKPSKTVGAPYALALPALQACKQGRPCLGEEPLAHEDGPELVVVLVRRLPRPHALPQLLGRLVQLSPDQHLTDLLGSTARGGDVSTAGGNATRHSQHYRDAKR